VMELVDHQLRLCDTMGFPLFKLFFSCICHSNKINTPSFPFSLHVYF
jgi:hypothetical protein